MVILRSASLCACPLRRPDGAHAVREGCDGQWGQQRGARCCRSAAAAAAAGGSVAAAGGRCCQCRGGADAAAAEQHPGGKDLGAGEPTSCLPASCTHHDAATLHTTLHMHTCLCCLVGIAAMLLLLASCTPGHGHCPGACSAQCTVPTPSTCAPCKRSPCPCA
jgi:hypothetical protein